MEQSKNESSSNSSDSEGNEESSWLLDCMVQYLKSPMWTVDICDFIDDHCIAFAGDAEEENSLEFTEIHNKFKLLVDSKLEEFCQEFGIT